MVSLKKTTAFFFEVYFKQFSFFLMRLIHVCNCILCSFNGEVFKHWEEKEKPAFFSLFIILLAFLSLQIVTLHIAYKSWAFCNAVHFKDGASFFFCLFINEVLPRQSMSPNHRSFWGPGSPVFSSTNGRGPAALKLFDQVSCRETLCINWHIGTTTEAPLVNNYWSFKLWPQLSPS